jgi:DNA-binding NtrC family response regulator
VSDPRLLRILSLEDDARDSELIQELLRGEDIPCELSRVDTEAAFVSLLEQGNIDLILADYTLPGFDGVSALKLACQIRPEVPFLFVTGTLGEEVAIEALKLGAADYVLKTRLSRLAPSVARALRGAKEIAERKRAEQALRRSEAYLAEAQRLSRTGSFGWNVPSGKISWSSETYRIFEVPPETTPTVELVLERTHPEDREIVRQIIHHASAGGISFDTEYRLLLGAVVKHVRVVSHLLPSDNPAEAMFVGAITDITDAKQAEMALRRSEGYLAEAQRLTHTGNWVWSSAARQSIHWSLEHFRVFGFDPGQGIPDDQAFAERIHPEDRHRVVRAVEKAMFEDRSDFEIDFRIAIPGGTVKYIRAIGHPILDAAGELLECVGTAMDVTEQHEARAALEIALAEIKTLRDQLYKENLALREEIVQTSMFEEIVGESPALQAVLGRVSKVAPTDSSVLITGETGTGKELIARAIHRRSQRSERAFVCVNCAAIPTSLISSELFGHEKGAFTGAVQRRLGRFELAEGGTIFLDEVGELPPETQIALLRVLQEREFERVGGNKAIAANVRVIAATNRDLQRLIEEGAFRRDLYYRLNVFPIEMPPLRQRKEDIQLLVEYFIDRYSTKAGKRISDIERQTMERLKDYAWPGNIRELQNVIERSIVLCEEQTFRIDESWLPVDCDPTEREMRTLRRIPPEEEKITIEAALAEAQGQVSGPTGAAARLGIPPSTLDSKIRTLKINKYRFRAVPN